MPTDHEFNDYSPTGRLGRNEPEPQVFPESRDMSHAMQEALQAAKDELLANSTKVTDLANVLPDDHPAAGHTSISLPKAEAFARGEHPAFDTYPGHSADVTIGACRPTAPCPACRQRLEDKERAEAVERGNAHWHGKSCVPGPVAGCMWCQPATTPEPRTLMQIVGQHRAVAGASVLEITELVAELYPFITAEGDALMKSIIADARQLRGDAMRATHVGWAEDYDPDGRDAQRGGEHWDEQHPGLAALLRAVDGDPSQITDAMVATYRRAHYEAVSPGYHGDDCIRAGLAAVISTIRVSTPPLEPAVWDGSDECYHELGTMEPLGPHHLDTWFRALELTNRSQYTPEEHVAAATVYLRILLSPPVIPDA